MKRVDLILREHDIKIGNKCPYFEPNILEDSLFYLDGEPVGFYIKKLPDKICNLANIANTELRSPRVPKSEMHRIKVGGYDEKTGRGIVERNIKQYSTIIGGVPPKPHMKRPYPTVSSVHSVKSAATFIKAMLMLAKEAEEIVLEILPEQYYRQLQLLENIPSKFKLGNLFTSSISNYNISAAFHRDAGNIVGASNVIITKRENSQGGNLHVPDYGATMDSADNSMLFYPAWKNVHGVTPIIPTAEGGYRNSLVFYPLKAFLPKPV